MSSYIYFAMRRCSCLLLIPVVLALAAGTREPVDYVDPNVPSHRRSSRIDQSLRRSEIRIGARRHARYPRRLARDHYRPEAGSREEPRGCLLYTSDAAD